MNRRILVLVMALLLCALSACALAQTTTGTAYGIYSMEGEHADSLIRLTLTVPEGYRGDILLDKDWQFDDGRRAKDLKSGEYVLLPRTMKDKYFKPERTAK